MKIVTAGLSTAVIIEQWRSHGVSIGRLAHCDGSDVTDVALARFIPGGTLGEHVTKTWQLFAVMEGAGWVSGRENTQVTIAAGEAALWWPGEAHASGSVDGMTVCIIHTSVNPLGSRRADSQ